MGIAVFPAASAGGIKSVQRGSAGGAGTVTITAVDITKSFVNIFGTTSSGTVAASASVSGNINASSITGAATMPQSMMFMYNGSALYYGRSADGWTQGPVDSGGSMDPNNRGVTNRTSTITANNLSHAAASIGSGALSGGSNNLVAAVVQGYLSGSTSLVVSGACRWEVVEFN